RGIFSSLFLTERGKNNAARESLNSDKTPPVFRTVGRDFVGVSERRGILPEIGASGGVAR
ncbi:MAG: hypothetical protein ACM3TN_28530, partial [Alphaproteobacteria bacterium]